MKYSGKDVLIISGIAFFLGAAFMLVLIFLMILNQK